MPINNWLEWYTLALNPGPREALDKNSWRFEVLPDRLLLGLVVQRSHPPDFKAART